MNKARAALELIPAWLVTKGLHLMPRRFALAVGRGAGRLACALDASHRGIADENLKAAFGDTISPKHRARLVHEVFAHFGTVAVESLLMERLGPHDIDRMVEYEGVDHIRKAFLKGKGVLVFSGHFGNWEMVALMQGWLGYPMAMVTRRLDNPHLERLLQRGRTRSGNEVVHKRHAMRGILRALKHAWCVAIVIDQDTRGADHVFADFFGRPAATTPTLARVALKTGAPIVPVFGVPLPDGRYRITYLPEVEVAPTGNREANVLAITQECTHIIEEWVRRHPSLWLWMHKRWKTRPARERETQQTAAVREGS